MGATKPLEQIVDIKDPSESPTCKFPKICDRTRRCENFQRHDVGCGVEGTVHRWDEALKL